MIILFLSYAALVVGISWWAKQHRSGEEYLMGGRTASGALVAAALFTLVGGGELVTLTALAYTYGFSALALFVGYSLGFWFLAAVAKRIRRDLDVTLHLSLPDYAHSVFGPTGGRITFLVSFGAFYAMLLIQFTAAGQILAPLTGLTYEQCVVLTAGVATLYLLIGGFRAVLATDAVQGIARLVLMPLLVYAVLRSLSGHGGAAVAPPPLTILPGSLWLSFVVTGFFSASSSADVWQRIYAARSDIAARAGLVGGGILLLVFGSTLVWLGIVSRSAPTVASADQAFVGAMQALLPTWAVVSAVVLILSTIMSTADTELFLVSGMALREVLRIRGTTDPAALSTTQSVSASRWLLIAFSVLAVSLSLVIRELIAIYTWLLSALLVIAPALIASLFVRRPGTPATISMIVNATLFIGLAVMGQLTPENAYLILVPGLAVFVLAWLAQGKRERVQAR